MLKSRRLKWGLICSPFLLSLGLVLFYWITNWWGARQFERTVAELKAEGFPATMEEAFGSRGRPEDEVFLHPALMEELARPAGEELSYLKNMRITGLTSDSKAWKTIPDRNEWSDVRKWVDPPRPGESEGNTAKSILAMIEPQSVSFDALREALDRPAGAWFFGRAIPAEFPDFSALLRMERLGGFARDHAILRLVAGESPGAAADVEALFKLQAALAKRPGSVGFMCAADLERFLFAVIREGTVRGVWNDTQLQSFQLLAEKSDPQQTAVASIRGEMAYTISWCRVNTAKPGHGKDDPDWKRIGERLRDAYRKRSWEDLAAVSNRT